MILTDYFRSDHDISWDYARQCGVEHGVIRLPEDDAFDITDPTHWETVCRRFRDFGITPLVVEPMPNALHDHIKTGDGRRDESIDKVIRMLPLMRQQGLDTICFNFMAHIGWLRTDTAIPARGGARVTGFDLQKFTPTDAAITAEELWDNYTYFLKAVLPHAEKHGIKLALHPDDPPLEKLGNVSRIMTSYTSIQKAITLVPSENLGVTMCQATYLMMGEDLHQVIPALKDKIFFIHFRNARGHKQKFNETFHDDGAIDMADIMRLYQSLGIDVPIRVDHVPLLAGETNENAGYTNLGRLFAIGYLKGLLDSTKGKCTEG